MTRGVARPEKRGEESARSPVAAGAGIENDLSFPLGTGSVKFADPVKKISL